MPYNPGFRACIIALFRRKRKRNRITGMSGHQAKEKRKACHEILPATFLSRLKQARETPADGIPGSLPVNTKIPAAVVVAGIADCSSFSSMMRVEKRMLGKDLYPRYSDVTGAAGCTARKKSGTAMFPDFSSVFTGYRSLPRRSAPVRLPPG
jgi:hypothetical protein